MKAVVLFSGGLDSTVLLTQAVGKYGKVNVEALAINYGQKHVKELGAAEDITKLLGVQFETIMLVSLYGQITIPGSSQTEPDIEVPKGHYADESMRKTFVPNRNMIMLSIAAGRAIGLGADIVLYAAHLGDHAIYPDCRPAFVYQVGETVRVGNYDGVLKFGINAPYLRKTKSEIVRIGRDLGAPLDMSWSCYEGGEIHCGECGTCTERKEAFKDAGVEDPTRYAS